MAHGKFEGEGWRVRKDGTRFWASVLIDPIWNADGGLIGFAKVTRDMTEYRAIQEQLHQKQKMEAIGQLTGGVAHDFNNLLTVIIGNLDTIQRHLPQTDERLRRAAEQACRGAQRAATLTQQLLAYARQQPLNPRPCNVNRLVAEMAELLRRTLSENIWVETLPADGLWRVSVDAHQLESTLLNLAVNSRDAMPNGGTLTIETSNITLTGECAVVRFDRIAPGQYVQIRVSDTGTGMAPEVLARAFDPFYTTKPIGQGTGLGLSQVFGFVKQSNGHVDLDSKVGRGTTVRILLPRITSPDVEAPDEPSRALPEGRSEETILVVEDDEDVRIYSTESLRELKFRVIEAASVEDALAALRRHPDISLLFADVGLPGVDGRTLAELARQQRPGLKVLLTTGYARDSIVQSGRVQPGIRPLTKPFTRSQLAIQIRGALDESDLPNIAQRTVLVAEDEELVRLFLVENLEGLGLRTVQAGTSAGALGALTDGSKVDAAIIDIGLPDRSGLELAHELRDRYPGLPLVIASGYGSGQLGSFSKDSSVAYLSKPYDEGAVARVLQSLGIIPDD